MVHLSQDLNNYSTLLHPGGSSQAGGWASGGGAGSKVSSCKFLLQINIRKLVRQTRACNDKSGQVQLLAMKAQATRSSTIDDATSGKCLLRTLRYRKSKVTLVK